MVYWEQGLEVPFGRKKALQMYASVESAIAELLTVFPPPKPKTSDIRHQHLTEAVQKYEEGNCDCGVYHFARWVATGQKRMKDLVLSRDIISIGAHVNHSFNIYIHLTPLIQTISLLFQAVDPAMHLHCLQEYRYVTCKGKYLHITNNRYHGRPRV